MPEQANMVIEWTASHAIMGLLLFAGTLVVALLRVWVVERGKTTRLRLRLQHRQQMFDHLATPGGAKTADEYARLLAVMPLVDEEARVSAISVSAEPSETAQHQEQDDDVKMFGLTGLAKLVRSYIK